MRTLEEQGRLNLTNYNVVDFFKPPNDGKFS